MNTELDNSNISKHLGKVTGYKSTYDPSLLVREPRINNRRHLGITDEDAPFGGYDIWNAYEVSCLTNEGMPVAAIAKIVYPCKNKYIVESKSIKLYLNSFNMQKFEGNTISVLTGLQKIIARDLSKLLETDVKVYVRLTKAIDDSLFYPPVFSNKDYPTLENNIDVTYIKALSYVESPDILGGIKSSQASSQAKVQRFHSALLKSNCRVTSQPDWGDVYIHYKGKYEINPTSLLQYIVSFRDECHFHEEICETIYMRLFNKFEPEELVVTCLYVRRGGIDINPTRASNYNLLDKSLIDEFKYFTKTVRQ